MNDLVKKLEREEGNIQCANCKQVKELIDVENDTLGLAYKCRCGMQIISKGKPKCKYFKRHPKYITCKGLSKIVTRSNNGHKTEIRYAQGKFEIKKVY
jgi:hypothetical protein